MKWLVLTLLVAVSVTSALGEQIFDEWVYPQEAFEFDQRGANLQLGSSDTIRLILDDGENVIITLGSSKRLQQYLITYNAIDREICDHNDCDPKRYGKTDPTTFGVIPGINLEIEKLEPELDIDRDFSETSILLGEEILVEVTVENTGGAIAKNIEYEDVFPEGLRVKEASKGTIQNNGVYWSIGSLQEGESVSIRYELVVEQALEASLAAFIKYTFDDLAIEYNSPSKTISTRELLDIDTSQDPTSFEMGESGLFIVTIENTNEDELQSVDLKSLVLDIPETMTVLDYPSRFRKTGNSYILEETDIDSGEILEYEFELESEEALTDTINGTLKPFFRDVLPTISFDQKIVWKDNRDHDYEVQVFPTSRDYLEGTTARFRAIVINNDDFYELEDINVRISYQNESRSFYVASVPANQAYTTDTWEVELPLVNKSTSEKGLVNFSFRSELVEETFDEELSFTVGIKDIKDAITVTKDLSDSSLEPNETALVTVFLENKLTDNSVAAITVEELVPDQFQSRNIVPVEISLEDEEKKAVYTYQITAPFYVDEANNWLNTTVRIEDLVLEASTSIDIELEKPDLSVSRSIVSSARKGAIIEDPFELTNSGDVNVYNITFERDASSGFEILSAADVPLIAELEPGESVTLQLPARLSRNGVVELGKTTVILNDVWGNKHEYEVSEKQITVEDASVVEPLLNIQRNVLTVQNTKLFVEALIYNVGGKQVEASYFDEDFSQVVTIEPDNFARLTYEIEVSPTPSLSLDAPQVMYEAQTQNWLSVGSSLEINRTLTSETENATLTNETSDEVVVLSQTGSRFSANKGGLSSIVGPGTIIAVLLVAVVLGVFGFGFVRKKILHDRGKSEFDELAEGRS